jgi:hypothetical protein
MDFSKLPDLALNEGAGEIRSLKRADIQELLSKRVGSTSANVAVPAFSIEASSLGIGRSPFGPTWVRADQDFCIQAALLTAPSRPGDIADASVNRSLVLHRKQDFCKRRAGLLHCRE